MADANDVSALMHKDRFKGLWLGSFCRYDDDRHSVIRDFHSIAFGVRKCLLFAQTLMATH